MENRFVFQFAHHFLFFRIFCDFARTQMKYMTKTRATEINMSFKSAGSSADKTFGAFRTDLIYCVRLNAGNYSMDGNGKLETIKIETIRN